MDLKVGQIWRAKKPRACARQFGNYDGLYNDRQIIWVGLLEVQYDSPAIPRGHHYKRVSKADFEKWAGEDVTDKMPKGEWAKYE